MEGRVYLASTRIESELEVKTYLQNMWYALNNGARINFQVRRVINVWG